MAGFAILALSASLQIGATYSGLLILGVATASRARKEKLPRLPLLAMVLVPGLLWAAVVVWFPRPWEGFLENARTTPFLTGLRVPNAGEVLKLLRTAPGVIAAAGFLGWFAAQRRLLEGIGSNRFQIVCLTGTLAAVGILLASLGFLSANTVAIANYLQPLVVGCSLAWVAARALPRSRLRQFVALFLALACVCSIRAIGLTTWGLACAVDESPSKALRRVEEELERVPPGQSALLSAAYLYQAARHSDVRWIHCDYPGVADLASPLPELRPVAELKPAKLILTQFDYYRRYKPVLDALKARPEVAQVRITQMARVPAPDSIRSLQRVLQHVCWAPVIVDVSWKP